MGTWIEIDRSRKRRKSATSRSLRGNVDRNINTWEPSHATLVVPYVGTWIEILMEVMQRDDITVVPYVGTWIEIHSSLSGFQVKAPSFPTWERG